MKIQPKFNRDLPENCSDFFKKSSGDEFKASHPIAYPVLVIIGLVALLAPPAIFVLLMTNFIHTEIGPIALLGAFGGFVFGIGLFNIVAAFLEQYLGHIVTIYSLSIGMFIMVITWFLI